MADTYSVFRTFIASPGDVQQERQITEEAVANINMTVRDVIGATIQCHKWEDLPPVTPNLPEERLQDILNREVDRCNFFVLILNKRYGRIEPGHSKSNTEREIDTILAARQRDPRLRILAYFRSIENNPDPGDQEAKVIDLRNRLEQIGVAYRIYNDPIEFRDRLTHDLYDVVLRIHISPFKRHALTNFWRFGETGRRGPSVAVVYPPVERAFSVAGRQKDYWLNRLSAQIAIEDHKAIQKIEKDFNLLRFRDYRIYTQADVPPELPWMNRIWLCVPRNRQGRQALLTHVNTRFSLPLTPGRPSVIEWHTNDGSVEVTSPMGEYLRRQRKKMDIKGEWNAQLAHVIAKDFAVLARLRRELPDAPEPLWDYYFAGIRGLGTWGAAWFVDQEYKQLQRFDKSDNVELLLEVTYRDGKILEVTDISSKPRDYFAEANDPETIDAHIRHSLYTA
jgi:Domain of unknown function (DUF4062)